MLLLGSASFSWNHLNQTEFYEWNTIGKYVLMDTAFAKPIAILNSVALII